MANKITAQPMKLRYRDVAAAGAYTEVTGILKGWAMTQEATGTNPIKDLTGKTLLNILTSGVQQMTFELVKFDLADLPALIGGTYDSVGKVYKAASTPPMIFKEFVVDFGTGLGAQIFYNGQIMSNANMPDDAALGFQITVTALEDATGATVGYAETAPTGV